VSTLFNNTLIFGLGLIGGSFSKSLKDNNLSKNIFAADIDEENIDMAIEDKVIVGKITDIKENIDLIIIATPLKAYKDCFDTILNLTLADNVLIIDLGSLKGFVLDIVPNKLKDKFIGCHPIAGSQESGYKASKNDLFNDKDFIICTNDFTIEDNFNKLTKLVEAIGSNKILLDEDEHDEIFCLTSHLPQFLSFMTKELTPKNIDDEFFTNVFRLDHSNSVIWDDIFKLNEENLEESYLDFFDNLENNIEALDEDMLDINIEYQSADFDANFLEDNFAAIFFRFIVVKSYLETIPEECSNFTGSGYKDFTSITAILSHSEIDELIAKNKNKILKLFDKISLQ